MKKNKIRVSVILTSYNHSKFIRESIESVLNQTYTNFELIIWDDASTDNSWEIIQTYTDPRMISFQNEINLGGFSISRAIKEVASGEYIAILHSDDAWEATKLDKQVSFLDSHRDVAAVFSHVQVIDEEGLPFNDKNHFYYDIFDQPNRDRFGWLRYFFYQGNALCHPSILIRKNCYKELIFRNGMIQLPDYDLWIQLCMKFDIHVLQEKLVRFRVMENEANQSGNRPETRIRRNFEKYQSLLHFLEIKSIDELIRIFPEAEKYIHNEYCDIHFAIGMIALENNFDNPSNFFGLDILFRALNDRDRAPYLERYFGFNKKSFVKLTGNIDAFSVEIIHDLRNTNQRIQQKNKELADKVRELLHNNKNIEQEMLFYASSKSWAITRPIRKLRKILKGNKKT